MATVTGYTATRMKAIEDASIVNGTVVNDQLILSRYNGTTVNAGNVRGAQGVQGVPGEITTAAFNSGLLTNATNSTNELKTRLPAGSTTMWLFPVLPNGWLSLEGQTVLNANTLYPDLYAAAPVAWRTGTTSLILPNMKGRVPVHQDITQAEFNVLEGTGGSKTRVLLKANIPIHTHGINHTHPSTTVSIGSQAHVHNFVHDHAATSLTINTDTHTHTFVRTLNPGTTSYLHDMKNIATVGALPTTGDPGWLWGNTTGVSRLTNTAGQWGNGATVNSSDTHGHTGSVDIPSTSGNTSTDTHTHTASVALPAFTGASEDGTATGLGSTAFSLLNPYFVLRFIIKT